MILDRIPDSIGYQPYYYGLTLLVAMTHIPTGFSAPTSEQNDVSMQNISSSSGSIHVHENDQKKHKLIMLKAPSCLGGTSDYAP